jgi:adhesin transport system outer membrane protein
MMLGQMPPAPAGIDSLPGKLPTTIAQALAEINDKHPAIALQLAQIDAAKANVRTARSQHLPNVSVSYGKQVYQGSGQGDYVAQINVSVPIFTGGSATGATDTALAQLQAAEFDLQDLRLTLREKLLSAWTDAGSAKSRGELGVRQSKTAQTLVEGYESQFKIGRRSLLDLLNVQNDLYTYQSNTVIAQFDLRIAQSRILAASGKLASSYTGARPEELNPGTSRGRLQLVHPDQGASAQSAMPVTVATSYYSK